MSSTDQWTALSLVQNSQTVNYRYIDSYTVCTRQGACMRGRGFTYSKLSSTQSCTRVAHEMCWHANLSFIVENVRVDKQTCARIAPTIIPKLPMKCPLSGLCNRDISWSGDEMLTLSYSQACPQDTPQDTVLPPLWVEGTIANPQPFVMWALLLLHKYHSFVLL